MQDNDTPYLMRGTRQVATESSTLVSSSPYLNNPRLREWIATAYLRRSGKDRPTSADAYELHTILRDILDLDRIEELFTAQRKKSPELDRWFSEGFSSTFTVDELLAYPEGSIGYIFGRYLRTTPSRSTSSRVLNPETSSNTIRCAAGKRTISNISSRAATSTFWANWCPIMRG